MTKAREVYEKMISAMNVPDLTIPASCVKFYKQDEVIPKEILDCEPHGLTLTSCQSARQAGFGDSILLTSETIFLG